MSAAPRPLLTLRDIHKAFGPVQALRGVALDARSGEVHALIGENGAGKSTLVRVLSGACVPDAGEIVLDGRPFRPPDPAAGRRAGIAMIYQELTLAPHLSVEANITLGAEQAVAGWLRPDRARVSEVMIELGHDDVDLDAPAGSFSVGLQQVFEIARALYLDARVVIMDEPTSSLSAADTEALFTVVARLRDRGIAVVYITHFLEEVHRIADRYTVLRDGESVGTGEVAGTTIDELIRLMVGRDLDEMYPRHAHELGNPVLTADSLHGVGLPTDAGFVLRRGEILGIAGLVGAGRSETLRALFGLAQASGQIKLSDGRALQVRTMSPPRSLQAGIDYLSEDRKTEGLAGRLSVTTNITLSAIRRYARCGFLRLRDERDGAARWCETLGVRYRDGKQPVEALSGGNQQKIAVARLLHQDCDVLLLDEPTRGIDVGSKAEINGLIQKLAGQGKAIVYVSSYLPELLGVCDSIAVMHRGRMSDVRPAADWSEHQLMQYATAGAV